MDSKKHMPFYAVWDKKENENRIKIKEKIRVRTFEKNLCEKDVTSEKAFGGWSVALMYSSGFWKDGDGFTSLQSTEPCPCPSHKWEDLSPDYELLIPYSSDDSLMSPVLHPWTSVWSGLKRPSPKANILIQPISVTSRWVRVVVLSTRSFIQWSHDTRQR